jgi:PAS domain S-box-containing protein
VPLRVLLVEGSEDDAALLLRELRRAGYDPSLERVHTPGGMERALSEAEGRGEPSEVVISAYRTSRFGAPGALTLLSKLGRDLPLIVVCDEGEEEAAVAMMRAGARDCVTRGRAARLGPAMERELTEAATRRERERTAEALKQSEERFRLLANEVVEGIVLIENGVIFDANESFTRMYGYGLEELVGMSPVELVTPDTREIVSRRISTGNEEPYEAEGLKRDDTAFPIEVRPRRIPYEGRKVRVSSVLDLTERKRSEEALREAQERFRSAFDNAPIGVAVVDLDGRFLQVNRCLCEILGYPEEVLLATTFREITHPDDVEASMEQVRRAMRDEVGSYSLEKRYLAAGGRQVWVSLSVSLVRDAEGKPLYFVDQIQDITGRKLAERELARRAEALAHANAELEQFSYSVSHDLRGPLRSIDGFSQILLEDYAARLDEEGRSYLRRVRAASQHMGHLMDDLLDLFR